MPNRRRAPTADPGRPSRRRSRALRRGARTATSKRPARRPRGRLRAFVDATLRRDEFGETVTDLLGSIAESDPDAGVRERAAEVLARADELAGQ